jgi:hypothetical protein
LRYVGKDTTLESLKELRRLISAGESESNAMCHKVCKWIVENNKNPLAKSMNLEERYFSRWIGYQRQVKSGNEDKPFYSSNLNIAKMYNLDNLFDILDYEIESNNKCHEVCQWIIDNDKYPSSKSNYQVEYDLGQWIIRKRSGKNESNGTAFYESDIKISESYGIIGLFESYDPEKISNNKCIEFCEFVKKHEHKPSLKTSCPKEKKLRQWLTRNIFLKNSNSKLFYDSTQKIIESYNLENLFAKTDKESISNDMCHKVCQWVIDNEYKVPSEKTNDEIEKKYSDWLRYKKQSKKLNRSFYKSDQKIAEDYGLIDIFDMRNFEQESNDLTIQLCEFYKANCRFPYESGDDLEKKVSRHLKSCRAAKIGKSGSVWYDSDQKIAESYGFDKIFDNLPQLQSNENCKSFCEFIIAEKRFPVGSKNAPEFERRLRKWHDSKKAIYLGKKSGAFYESDILIATSFGFADLFELSSYSGDKE